MTKFGYMAALAFPALRVAAQEYSWHQPAMCTEGSCGDCPNRLIDSSGYPVCQWYDLNDNPIWNEQFASDDQGGLEVYFDIAQPDPGCAVVIRSPAGSEYIGCGQNILSSYNALCTKLILRQRVMLQFCCGTGDCTDAGAGQPMLLSRDDFGNASTFSAAGGGGGGAYLFVDSKGNVIRPDSETNEREQRLQARKYEMAPLKKREERHPRDFHARQDDCTFNQIGDPFTAPGDTRVIDGPVTGPATIDRGVDQTVGWSSTFEVGLSFEIFSAGASFTVEESVTESASIQLEVEDSVTGYWVWTPILTCARGSLSGSCSGEGQACSPTVNGDGNVVGATAFQIRG